MAITLTKDGTTLELDPDLLWSDEFEWSAVRQSTERGLNGSLIVQSAKLQAGRPITLAPEDDSSAWMSRAQLEQLVEWSEDAGAEFVLNLRGVDRTVLFRPASEDEGSVTAQPVTHFRDVQPGDWYRVTFRFLEL